MLFTSRFMQKIMRTLRLGCMNIPDMRWDPQTSYENLYRKRKSVTICTIL